MQKLSTIVICSLLLLFCSGASAQTTEKIPSGAKVYINPMDGFETFLREAIEKKKVPVTVVDDKSQADYEITGASDSQKAGLAKKLIMGSWHSREEASVNIVNIKTGVTVFAYSVHKENSAHGKRSTAEACAKHLKDKMEEK